MQSRYPLVLLLTLILVFTGAEKITYGKDITGTAGVIPSGFGEHHNILEVTIQKSDGSTVLLGRNDILEVNSDVDFYVVSGCAGYEYSISGDEGKHYSRYRGLKGNRLRLFASENRQADGIWYLCFRGLDTNGGIISESLTYRLRFDLTPPELRISTQKSEDGTGLLISASDSGSGVKSLEVRSGGRILYRRTEYERAGEEAENAFSCSLDPDSEEVPWGLTISAVDFAGNISRLDRNDRSFGDRQSEPAILSKESVFGFYRIFEAVSIIRNGNGVLTGLIIAVLLLTELAAALITVITARSRGQRQVFEKA
ncbi:MAG: hypothetical protein IJT16_00380 [Lachnospiraceae bacterium]|nr:hypothetical protein [Lachnospiraceae bacterium]